ncbi:MAG TPA: aspartate--tRNA ligase [bacterium]|nr:aspartate--tRNA ligase [bacterium]HQG46602.1 aspartate--tRNA ligase [bacterium]HQI49896.1 aspartate--tRNA ligase [bacterium]HQJ63583.1 aspartate--tRNA ligase [bacterium]
MMNQRTHTCGALRPAQLGQTVILMGWVDRRRDHGSLIFLDLRDRYGVTQVRIDPDAACYEAAKQVRNEYVLAIRGLVELRPEGMVNPRLDTGAVEVAACDLEVLNTARTTPFMISGEGSVNEDLRLKYRYLDLRRPEMQRNLLIRHRTAQIVRSYFSQHDFIEIETPILMKSTPEGARDYLVPSRVWKGRFYALPQSPQQYKQLLMVAGYDRYFQIVRCFRDEDLRADRQPEFTQIDVEMSFIDEEMIFAMVEGLMVDIFRQMLGIELTLPLPRLPFEEAMARYGSDKPDLRFGLEIKDISALVVESEFKVFREAVAAGGMVAGLCLPGCGGYSRKQIDDLTAWVKEHGGAGLVAIKLKEGDWESSLAKFFSDAQRHEIMRAMGAGSDDLLLLVADEREKAQLLLGDLRMKLAVQEKLIPEGVYSLVWIVDFPLFEYSPEEQRYVARHHPFTSPRPGDEELMLSDPGRAKARAYDLVLNGMEVAGGSIRIHKSDMQARMFQALGIEAAEAEEKFGFLLEAFAYGAPPHGGIAFGFDRLVMILAGCQSIREVIAFPKTASAMSLMDGCPSSVNPAQLKELGLRLEKEEMPTVV